MCTALRVLDTLDPRGVEDSLNLIRYLGRARCVVLNLVRLVREAVVVVQQAVSGLTRDVHFIRRPVGGDEDNGFGRLGRAQLEDLRHFGLQALRDGCVRRVAQHGHGAAAVRDGEHRSEARRIAAVGG